jgi:hypothetical protein
MYEYIVHVTAVNRTISVPISIATRTANVHTIVNRTYNVHIPTENRGNKLKSYHGKCALLRLYY